MDTCTQTLSVQLTPHRVEVVDAGHAEACAPVCGVCVCGVCGVECVCVCVCVCGVVWCVCVVGGVGVWWVFTSNTHVHTQLSYWCPLHIWHSRVVESHG